MALNLNTDLALINTTTNAGTITLPLSTTIPGRVITFKDITATFGQKTLTLNTTNPDTFEDGGTTKVLRESRGIIQIVGTSNKWYVLAGTQQNTLNISSLLANSISTTTISSLNASVSTINFKNNLASTLSMYQTSTLLYFNSNVFAGSKVLPGTVLNRYRFSPFYINNLFLWLDAADSTTLTINGTINATQWRDKSSNRYIGTGFGTNSGPSYVTNYLNGLPSLLFNGTNQYFNFGTEVNFGTTDFSVFTVINFLANGVYKWFFSKNQSSAPTIQFNLTNGNVLNGIYGYGTGGVGSFGIAGGYTPTTGTYLLSFSNGRTSSSTLHVNGTLQVTNSSASALTLDNGSPFYVARGDGGGYWDSYISEILIYKSTLTPIQRQQIEGYLAWKWSLQANLPASHPFYNAPPQ